MAHITGGGLAANLARVLPAGIVADDRPRDLDAPTRSSTWSDASARSTARDLEARPQHAASAWWPWSPPPTPTVP